MKCVATRRSKATAWHDQHRCCHRHPGWHPDPAPSGSPPGTPAGTWSTLQTLLNRRTDQFRSQDLR